ncbi:MAG: amino acid ABC transporter ATP-binding protein, partial [Alphaproteobacteria bacterium]|nr:amino acid ABC transporter ATP-binding protein [Alphaproteobacteria bacterium]
MALLEIRALRRRIGGNEVLAGIDLDVEAGEVLALIGRSGSGKSSLLRCIGGLDAADSGRIVIDGIDIADTARKRDLRERIGMVFQSFNLFPHLSGEGNVTLALRKGRGISKTETPDIPNPMR